MFRLNRTSPRWLRASLAVLLLAFTLNLAAHAAHTHDDAKVAQAAHAACGYCAAFGTLADAPSQSGGFTPLVLVSGLSQQPSNSIVGWLVETAAHPRAPPIS
jgi:hypothetical protein